MVGQKDICASPPEKAPKLQLAVEHWQENAGTHQKKRYLTSKDKEEATVRW